MSEITTQRKTAQRRLQEFEHKFGQGTLQLARHAALPVVLSPELLHFLRINFFFDPVEILPYTAETDLLLSPLCHEISDELYEIDPTIRDELLSSLVIEYGYERIQQIAALLWQYIERRAPWGNQADLERAQQLTALNFLDTEKAKQWLDEAEAYSGRFAIAEQEWFVAMRKELEKDELHIFPILSHIPMPTRARQHAGSAVPKILFVEAHSKLRTVLSELLNLTTNYEIIVAGNGLECVEMARAIRPDLILTGLRMPVMDGFEAIRILRSDPTTANIPIIVLSTWSSAKPRKQAFAAGANGYFTLPVDIERLHQRINDSLEQKFLHEHEETLETETNFASEEKLLMAIFGEQLKHQLSPEQRIELRELLESLFSTLTPREARILFLRFGFQNGQEYTLEEIAEAFGFSVEDIGDIEGQSLRKLRHPRRSRLLRGYLGNGDDNPVHQYYKKFGLSSKFYVQMREILIDCGKFGNGAKLKSIFLNSKLKVWRASFVSKPLASSTIDRVDAVIDFFIDKWHRNTNENGLLLLFQVLGEEANLADECRQRFIGMSETLKNILKPRNVIPAERAFSEVLQDILSEFCDHLEIDEITEEGLDDIPAMVEYLVDYLEEKLKAAGIKDWGIHGRRESYPIETIVTFGEEVYPIFAEFSWWSTHNEVIGSYLARPEVPEAFVILFSNNRNINTFYSFQKPVWVFPIIFESTAKSDSITLEDIQDLKIKDPQLTLATEEELVFIFNHGIREERQAAFSIIYERYKLDVWNFIKRKGLSEPDARDIFSEVWSIGWSKLRTFEWRDTSASAKPIKAWLISIAQRRFLEFFRRETQNKNVDLDERWDYIDTNLIQDLDLSSETSLTESQIEGNEILAKAISKLYPRERQIITLIYFEQKNSTEIGQVLNMKPAAVRTAHSRVLKKLRKILLEEQLGN